MAGANLDEGAGAKQGWLLLPLELRVKIADFLEFGDYCTLRKLDEELFLSLEKPQKRINRLAALGRSLQLDFSLPFIQAMKRGELSLVETMVASDRIIISLPLMLCVDTYSYIRYLFKALTFFSRDQLAKKTIVFPDLKPSHVKILQDFSAVFVNIGGGGRRRRRREGKR